MDHAIKTLTWFVTNLETILVCLAAFMAAILVVLGVIVEIINKLVPTKDDTSALYRFGKAVTRFGEKIKYAGEVVQKLISWIPSNLKKPKTEEKK